MYFLLEMGIVQPAMLVFKRESDPEMGISTQALGKFWSWRFLFS